MIGGAAAWLAAAFVASYTPAPGTADRASIADAIRQGTGSTAVLVFDHLRITSGPGVTLAYAEVHPAREDAARPFSGWVLLWKEKIGWKVSWGIGGDGADTCSRISYVYVMTKRAAELADADAKFFSTEFQRDSADIASKDPGLSCVGDIVAPKD